jgi:hypothetical protein
VISGIVHVLQLDCRASSASEARRCVFVPITGPEFVSRALLKWIVDHGIDTALIDPGKPWQNGAAESFSGKFRDECLSLEWFRSRAEAKVVIESWHRHYNEVRPHSSLGYLTPATFAAKIKAHDAAPAERRGRALRYMEPPRSAPSHNRPARGNRRQQQGWSSQAKRGPKKLGRSGRLFDAFRPVEPANNIAAAAQRGARAKPARKCLRRPETRNDRTSWGSPGGVRWPQPASILRHIHSLREPPAIEAVPPASGGLNDGDA